VDHKIIIDFADDATNTYGDLEVYGFGSEDRAAEFAPVFVKALEIKYPEANINSSIEPISEMAKG